MRHPVAGKGCSATVKLRRKLWLGSAMGCTSTRACMETHSMIELSEYSAVGECERNSYFFVHISEGGKYCKGNLHRARMLPRAFSLLQYITDR